MRRRKPRRRRKPKNRWLWCNFGEKIGQFMYLQNFYALLIIIDLDTTVYKWLDIIVYNWMDRNIWDYNEIIIVFHRISGDPDWWCWGFSWEYGSHQNLEGSSGWEGASRTFLYHHWTQWIQIWAQSLANVGWSVGSRMGTSNDWVGESTGKW